MSGQAYSNAEMRAVLIAGCAGIFLMPMMSTMLNLALTSIGKEFDVGSHALAMINTIFFLSSVGSMVPLARIADIFGRKKIFIIGVFVVMAGAMVAAFSFDYYSLLMARLLMGVGSAAIGVTGISMITDVFSYEKRGWAIGVQTTFVYLGLALGPSLGGFICDALGWRGVFFLMIPIAALALFFMLSFRKEIKPFEGQHMDTTGSVVYVATIAVLMFGVMNMPEIWAVILTAIGIVLLLFFIYFMRGRESPVLDTSMFKYRMFSRSSLAAFMNYASSYSVTFFFALYLQNIGALTASQAGMILLAQPLMQVILTAKAGSLSDRMMDKRILPTAGMTLTIIGVVLILFVGTTVYYYLIFAILIILGIGNALFSAPNTTTMMSAVPPRSRGEAAGMISVVRQSGMMVSMGIAMCCISFIMGSADNLGPDTYGQFIDVMRCAFTICLIMCIIGTFVSWFRGESEVFE